MKKIIALALSLMMLLTCAAAFAEAADKQTVTMTGSFSVKYNKLPEYYTMKVLHQDENTFAAEIESSDASKPILVLSMAYSDEWAEVKTLADASEEDIAAVKDDFYAVTELDEGDLIFDYAETGLGTKLLVARSKDGEAGAIYCIYMGYEIEVDMFPGADKKPITDDDLKTVITFLTDIEFTPAEEAK